ncbi:class II aldolase/adducin family protein [Marivita sp. S6314]|uniref:class II aldolase/adducin family protein n=1 Tax=Marivita sp. S6314 TaxID=2926406 RepID=UPI001FF5AF18|nr:class II aldolase/adducin family protein [Marivita sp. S6314]MCK0149209.1 class II aldolase/adducin family protein [Marivita sp. S6314]
MTHAPPPDFRALSARLGSDPLQVQGPGGNTSIKRDGVMWIKASGTELADATRKDIFVAVSREKARAEAHGAGDGTCKATVLDPAITLRPSIETTFHALLDWPVVAHTHSVATLVHAISPQGRTLAAQKLKDLPVIFVPYRKPGLPLTSAIIERLTADVQVIILENHGLVCAGPSVQAVSDLIAVVEDRLALPAQVPPNPAPRADPPDGYAWDAAATVLATTPRLTTLAQAGSYYPDHVVFLGPALPTTPTAPACLVQGIGAALRTDATSSQTAMLRCLADVLTRLPADWDATPIGPGAEAELLDWDAEKYRQALAAKGTP